MAGGKDCNLSSANGAGSRCCASADSPTPASSKWLRFFTDSEWAAARELVLLSAGAMSSSALPSATTTTTTTTTRPHTPPDELRGGPRVRRQRRRTLASLYEATNSVGVSGRVDGNQKRRRVVSGDRSGDGEGNGYVYAVRRDGR